MFNKRYRQFLFAKSCNRAPTFDQKDNHIPRLVPKFTLQKHKQEIINENTAKNKSNKIYQTEFDLVTERAKKFIREIELK